MNRCVLLTIFAFLVWGVGSLLPWVDPYLLLACCCSCAPIGFGAGCLVCLVGGAWGEAVSLLPMGSLSGPLVMLFGMIRWAQDHFFIRYLGQWVACFSVAALGFQLMQIPLWGIPAGGWFLLPRLSLWQGVVGALSGTLAGVWLRWGMRPRRHRRIRISSYGSHA